MPTPAIISPPPTPSSPPETQDETQLNHKQWIKGICSVETTLVLKQDTGATACFRFRNSLLSANGSSICVSKSVHLENDELPNLDIYIVSIFPRIFTWEIETFWVNFSKYICKSLFVGVVNTIVPLFRTITTPIKHLISCGRVVCFNCRRQRLEVSRHCPCDIGVLNKGT